MNVKSFVLMFFAVLIGLLFGKLVFSQYEDSTVVAVTGEKLHFVALTYDSEDSMKKEITDYTDYFYEKENDSFVLYVGVTKKQEIVSKIKGFYEKKYNNITVKEKLVNEDSFLTILNEYDKMIEISTIERDITTIEKIVMSNYKEMVLKE